jgi:2-dehydropantoate 2-reductase
VPAPGESPIAVFGTGAVACTIGGWLARGGAGPVVLVGSWGAGREAIARRGIVVHEPTGTWSVRVAVASVEEPPRPVGQALVLTKSPRTPGVARALARVLAPAGLAVTLQNGLGHREVLEAALGRRRVAVGTALLGARLLSPGEVSVVPGRVVLGEEPETVERLRGLAARLRAARVEVQTTRDVPRLVWEKLVANCAINPLTALAGVPNGALLEDPELRATLLAAAAEVGAVAAARGIPLGDPGTIALRVAEATAANRSSMLQDLERGATSEIDALNGAVAAEGRRLGVPTPVNSSLWHRVREREGRPATEAQAPPPGPA